MTEARFADDMLFASGEDPVLAAAQNLLRYRLARLRSLLLRLVDGLEADQRL